MPKNVSVQNNFIRGLVTEATGLTFPENACTDTSNCVFSLIGDVTRRPGIDLEENFQWNTVSPNVAMSSYRWKNAGGDGQTEILVEQTGSVLSFFESTNATPTKPLSKTFISSLNFVAYKAAANPNNITFTECQFADGNGYLFVFHPDCETFYCSFNNGTIISTVINLQIRDFLGFYPEPGNVPINTRLTTITNEHQYNLENQGWTGLPTWVADSNGNAASQYLNDRGTVPDSWYLPAEVQTFTVQSGLSGISPSQICTINYSIYVTATKVSGGTGSVTGSVISYSGTSLVIEILQESQNYTLGGFDVHNFSIDFTITSGSSSNTLSSFFSAVGVYPSNTDIWYTFKNDTGAFDPASTVGNVGITTTPAPRGHFILNVFNQNQSGVSSLAGLVNLSTTVRASTGCWFQGRVFYTGVNSSQAAVGDQKFYTWSENIYFSQVNNANDTSTFGYCYQQNDPTDETFFSELPTDGGVISIQGCGNIYKLFPTQNGLIVHARNGVWFITGAQGIGFTATNYTVTKISSVQTISANSIIDVLGFPMFWNEEGIYRITTGRENTPYGFGGLVVEPMTVGTILSFYNQIPLDSKIYARGDYDPINYVVKWVFRSTQETGVTDRYHYDSVLNFNIYNKAFYPYKVSSGLSVSGLFYLNYPSSTAPNPSFKYVVTNGTDLSFAEERDETNWQDWVTFNGGVDYTSFFTTGYSLHGKGVFRWQPSYIYMYSRNDQPFAYTIQGNWDYSINNNSGRNTTVQTVINGLGQPNFGMLYRRHKIRGHGTVLQFTVSSVQGQPFDIIGWTTLDNIDIGV